MLVAVEDLVSRRVLLRVLAVVAVEVWEEYETLWEKEGGEGKWGW